jgi:putative ABC transport system permease protein
VAADLSQLALLSTPPTTDQASATPLREAFRSALHNLDAHRTRGLLTMLGIIIGITAVVLLIGIGNGLAGYVDALSGDYGGNNVVIQPTHLFVDGIDQGVPRRTLSLADAQALAEPGTVADAIAVSPMLARPASVSLEGRGLLRAGNANYAAMVVGVWPQYLTVGGYKVTRGSFITEEDVSTDARVIVLGPKAADALFPGGEPLGQTVWVNGEALRVVGLMSQYQMLQGFGSDMVYIPLSTALSRVLGSQRSVPDGSKAVDSITVRARSSTAITAVQQQSLAVLAARHQLEDPDAHFTADVELEAVEQVNQIIAAVNGVFVAVAAVSLLVGGIGVMNIMLVAVAERTREIGLRKAVGASDGDILSQFLMESTVISLVGAGIGLVLANLLVVLVGVLWRPSQPSIAGVVIAVGAALATGLFFGVSPARRAAALQPIEALRAE